ncbi:MAG TPA: SDR family oxidoreductase [Caulobacteraceae bacterium]|jgi:NAD(P)-dependent dehydrogenase (short-subunit alcohol dehydrogenase family)|nr:SDR family oxidoreductase [Caulobacteraceae bacterium]
MNTGLEGKVALVTGAASGIGRACALALAAEGMRVIIADIDAPAGEAVRREIGGPGARFQLLDVASADAWGAAIAAIEAREGALNVLVNNAGICIAVPVLEMSHASWRRQMEINLDGVFLGTQAALPLMARSGGGSMVNISSVAGLKGLAGLAGYCASKGGVRLFTKAVALECAQAGTNIRVNSIHPGAIETPIWVKLANDGVMPDVGANALADRMQAAHDQSVRATPLGFAGQPSDIAAGVVYLCSEAARFITGAELVIDGGAAIL